MLLRERAERERAPPPSAHSHSLQTVLLSLPSSRILIKIDITIKIN